MQWIVEGADKSSGEDRVISVDALDKAQAEQVAARQGILVSEVRPPTFSTPAEKLAAMSADAGDSQILSTTTLAGAVNYRSPAVAAVVIAAPEYAGLKIGSTILMIVAMLYYILTAFILFALIITAVRASSMPIFYLPVVPGIFAAMVTFAMGGVLHAASAACLAIRDMARNSFTK
ncbi:MAG TPA: hypothetical protein VGF52_07150 [Tepidisphaeraceae bacterium]